MKKLNKSEEKAFTRYLFHQYLISEGSGRIVYSWNDKVVIKVAKNRNGVIQNRTEVERFRQYGDKNFARIYAYSKKIIIMEKVNKPRNISLEKGFNKLAMWFNETFDICCEDSMSQGKRKGTNKSIFYDYGYSKKLNIKRFNHDYYLRERVMSNE
jgi:hypothetical protein